jgi:hypothetical protein
MQFAEASGQRVIERRQVGELRSLCSLPGNNECLGMRTEEERV